MSSTTSSGQAKVMREIKDAKGNVVQIQEESSHAAPTVTAATKHAAEAEETVEKEGTAAVTTEQAEGTATETHT